MRYMFTSLFILTLSSSVLGKEGLECPNRGDDPSKFCLPGQIWNEEIKECVDLVWPEISWKYWNILSLIGGARLAKD